MKITDLPSYDDFHFDEEGNRVTPAAQQEAAPLGDLEVPDLVCADGWVVDMLHQDHAPTASPAVLGASVFVAEARLADALTVAGAKHQELMAAGFFDIAVDEDDEVSVNLLPHALGSVTDADGNEVELEEDDAP